MSDCHPPLPRGRASLAAVIQAAGDVLQTTDAMQTLQLSRTQASKLLARWAKQGWLQRVGQGAYLPVPPDQFGAAQVMADPWVLVPTFFAPCYIGGRTAAAHWDLTEQLFRDVCVCTARHPARLTVEHAGTTYTLKHRNEAMLFGTKTVWRGRTRVAVSDPHRTIIDLLDDPVSGGGIQHVADCFARYLRQHEPSPDLLLEYGQRCHNGAIFKRLGYLAERHAAQLVTAASSTAATTLPAEQHATQHATAVQIATAASKYLSKGNTKLDPSLNCPRLITRWRLFIPPSWDIYPNLGGELPHD